IAVATAEEVVEGLEIDGLVIPVVTQEEYWIEVFFNGIIIEQEIVQHVAVYDVELENFAAPLVDNVDLPEKYTDPSNPLFEQLNDTGLSQVDNVTSRTAPEIILEADLNEFFEEGISILTAAQAAAGVTPGAAVEVFVNGNSVGFADLIANSGNTLFRFTFTAGMLPFTDADPEASFITDSGGWLHYVKGAVRIFDGQQDGEGDPAPATGRTQLSEPLQLVVDTSGPGASTPNLLASSDSGRFNTDNVTHILTPAFDGTAEHNAIIRVFAIDVTDPGNPGPAELIGQGRVGTDLTQNGFNQVGSWEVTVEPLDDHSNNPSPLAHYASYRIITEVEDLAGNITRLEGNGLQIWIDAVAPNTPYLDVLGLEGPNLPGGTVSDTGRHDSDNVTFDNTPAVTVTADDTPQGDGNPFPNTIIYRIYDRPDPDQFNGAPNNGEVLLVDSFVTQGGFSANGFFLNVLPLLLDGVHNLKLEVEDLAGNMSEDFLLTVTIDTQIPPVSFGQPGDPDDGVAPDSDTGVAPPNPDTIIDRVTNDTTPKFWGRAEANTIVRVYADVNNNGTLQPGIDVYLGQTTAIPLDGNQAEPDGYWEIESIVDLNDPDFFPTPDGVRTIFITAEDLAGNVNAAGGQAADTLEIFVDTTGPVITDVYVTAVPGYDLFDPKPSTDGPSPLVYSLSIDFLDLPVRVAPDFLYDALKQDVAEQPGHYRVVGDANGVIPIQQVIVTQSIGLDNIARATVQLVFFEPLPDDRFTLTVSDSIMDPVGNRLDGENNAIEPQENPLFPTGDRVPGGEFIARFTIDSRPEIGVWAAGSVWVDTNGNFNFDPDNLDFTNRDITYVLAYTSDNVFNGNFVFAAGDTADGFDKLAAYGRVGGQYRWLIDTDNDGVPNLDVNDPASVNGLPVAGRFDNSDANGDEVGLFTGSTWWFDTNHDFRVDYSLASDLIGYPIVGDFDGDGFDDLATYADDHFEFDLANGVRRGWDGDVDATIDFGFIGVRERPVAADMNQDGIDDIGLWVPGRSGATPEELSEWYFLISQRQIDGDAAVALPGGGAVPALNHPFTPVPFGDDLYARFGDEYAMPLVGNFDPPATVPSGILPTGIAELTATLVAEPTPINTNGKVDTLPESDETIDEWESYWVEIWVDTAQTGGIGVTLALVDLTYNTDCFTPTAIEYGPAFTENRMGTIDDVAGVIDDLGAGSTLAQLGDGEYVLVARVRFEPTADDSGLAVSTDAYTDAATCNVEILEARVALADDRSATVRLASPPATELQPFIYDLDDDGEVGLGDLSYFAAAYRETIGASAVPFVHASDFDRDGEVGLGDLSYFAAAYGRGRMDFFFAAGEEAEGVAAALAESSPPPGENTASSESSTAVDAALAVEYDDRQPEAINLVDPRVAWAETVARRSLPSKNDNLDENTLAIDLFYTEEQ
ncbi:MAG TPA: hypothetical protein VJL29_04890, partial [Thermoguttaceae bacterium]|nr:hypothetical protein [Thermoguttaceae bacterium]